MAVRFSRAGVPLITCDMQSGNNYSDPLPLLRQYQNAVFLPIMRVHELHGDRSRFPFAWTGPEGDSGSIAAAFRSALQLRMAFVPQIYSIVHKSAAELSSVCGPAIDIFGAADAEVLGIPPASPLPAAAAAAAQPPSAWWADQYMLGDSILPASNDGIEPGPGGGTVGTPGHAALTARLPPGGWYRFNSSAGVVVGPQNVTVASPRLDEIVVFVRGGSVLTLDAGHADKQTTADLGGVLEVHLYAAWPAACTGGGGICVPNVLVEDDGVSLEAPARRTTFVFDGLNRLSWTVAVEVGFKPGSVHYSTMTVTLFSAKGGATRHSATLAIGSGGNVTL